MAINEYACLQHQIQNFFWDQIEKNKFRLFEMGCQGIFPCVSFDKQQETETKNIQLMQPN